MNYQNIPRGDKTIKTAFRPKLDALMFFDYKAIEMRLLAFYMASCGDSSMVEAIRGGLDLHTESARAALGIYDRELTDEERQVGKVINFSIVYGGGAPTLMRQLGISYQEARAMLEAFHARWPGIGLVQQQIRARIAERGYITTLWGRHLHPESDHKALNALVQGCAADLMKAAVVKVDEWSRLQIMLSHPVSVIHDELILDAMTNEVAMLAAEIPRLMADDTIGAVIPVEVDVEISWTTWADKAPYEGILDAA